MPDWLIVWLIVGELQSEWQVVCQCLSKYPWIHSIVGALIKGGLIKYREQKIQLHDFLFPVTKVNKDGADLGSQIAKKWSVLALFHHHHIHFRALFSPTEGWAFWQVFLEGVLSTQNGSEGQQNPYLASFCHSQALHPMISLACQIFSVQPHSACVLLQSSLCCALHVQTISSYWCGAPHLNPGCQAVRRESELTSSFALTLQIQRIMARSLRRRRFSVSTFMAQVSAACSMTLLTHDEYTLPLVRRGRWRLVRRGSN